MPERYRKLVIHTLTGDFRSSTCVVEEPWRDPGPGEVAIRNHYAGCNAIFDKNLCRNTIRYVDVKPPFDMGIESVGEVVAVGPDVESLRVGDAVATSRLGSGYREYQVAPAARALRVAAPTPEILALIPSGISALVGLEKIGEARPGDTVAVSAAAGGLGHFVVQLAKLRGCHVIGITGDASKLPLLRALGVDRAIDHRSEDLREVLAREYPRGLDVAYDSVGGEVFDAFVDHLAIRGRLVISGHTSDFDREVELVAQPRIYRKLYWKSASVRGFQNQAFPEFFDEAAQRLLALHAEGRLQVHIEPRPFVGLGQVADAVEWLLAGRSRGKVVVSLVEPRPLTPPSA
ncbi:MAG: alcohol dehydrogenase [Gammaproteobacteria bacterium]|nr:alcohol dehydrogenase [Gammaproteobacteria bacterium]